MDKKVAWGSGSLLAMAIAVGAVWQISEPVVEVVQEWSHQKEHRLESESHIADLEKRVHELEILQGIHHDTN